jgi:hypothetical protein
MFGSNRYITRGINQELPMDLTIFLWSRVDALKLESDGDMDYLQVFELKKLDNPDIQENQLIIHRTEEPLYVRTYALSVEEPISDKVYVIDSGDYCTMILAREY